MGRESTMRLRVIVTTYNHERFVAQALDSILSQDTDFPFDVVVLEDCSTDGTRDIVLRYGQRWPGKVDPVLAPTNTCSNRPFMDAFLSSSAEYVALLDGDDYWTSPHKLQRQVDFLDAHPECSMCFHNAQVVQDDGTASWLHNRFGKDRFLTLDDLLEENYVAGCSPVIRRKALGEFPSWYETAPWGDLPLYILLAETGTLGYIDEVLACYRVHEGGLWSGRTRAEQLRGQIDFYEALIDEDLGRRHEGAIRAQIRRLRQRLSTEERRSLAAELQNWWLDGVGNRENLVDRIREVVSVNLPVMAPVAVVTHGDARLVVLDGRPAQHFASGAQALTEEKLFSGRRAGSQQATWIRSGYAYEFRLYGDDDRLLSAVTVTMSDGTPPKGEGVDEAMTAPFIAASPNPVPGSHSPGTTAVTWNAGDTSTPSVRVSTKPLDAFLIDDVGATLRHLEQLRADGVSYLVFPAGSGRWLEETPEVARHLERYGEAVVQDEACLIYSLDTLSSEAARLTTGAPTMSVVIPCYNQAHYLGEAIESALSQTYPSIEVIVVDDGSTDDTATVVASYPSVRYVQQSNAGLPAARNAGLAVSTGPMCIFLDADDRLTPIAAEIGADHLLRDDRYAFVSGHCTLIAPDGSPLLTPDQFLIEDDHYRVLLRNNYIWNPGSVVYRRSVIEAFGGFDISMPAAEDYELYLRIVREFPVHCHDAIVVQYRQHARNMSGDASLMAKTITSLLQSQAEVVRGDAEAEAAMKAGLDGCRLFYGDELLQDMRRHWSRRVSRIEDELAGAVEPYEHAELIDEVRCLYRWILAAFGMKTWAQAQVANERALTARNGELKAAKEGAEQRVTELERELSSVAAAEQEGHQEAVELRRNIDAHLNELQRLASAVVVEQSAGELAALLDESRYELEYQVILSGVRAAARRALSLDASVLVVSRGDDRLLELGGLRTQHFPQTADGVHAGTHPADAQEALDHLDSLRADGASYLLLPRTELWWLKEYPGFEDGLEARGGRTWEDHSCVIYHLAEPSGEG